MSHDTDVPGVPKDSGPEDSDWDRIAGSLFARESLLTLVLIAFVLTRLWWLSEFTVSGTDTIEYGADAWLGVDRGEIAYRDFKIEYPPLAWWLMAAPRVIASERYNLPDLSPQLASEYLADYFWWFHLELFFADVLCFGMTILVGRRISRAAEWVLPATYTAVTIAQPHLVYDRLDVVLLLFFLLSIYCWLRSLEASPRCDLWACASYLFMGLGISFKIMPALCAPFLLLADLRVTKSAWRMTSRVLLLALGAAGPFLIQMRTAGWSVFHLFQFHSERPIHLESTWGSAMLVARTFGVPCEVVQSFGGFNLVGEWAPAMKAAAIVSAAAAGLALGLWALLRGRRFDRRTALDCAFLALINSTVLATVYSPQYLTWLVPISLLLAMSVFPKRWAVWCAFAALVIVIVGVSSWLYPYHYRNLELHKTQPETTTQTQAPKQQESLEPELVELGALPVMMSEIRSACLVALSLGLSFCFFARHGLAPGPRPSVSVV